MTCGQPFRATARSSHSYEPSLALGPSIGSSSSVDPPRPSLAKHGCVGRLGAVSFLAKSLLSPGPPELSNSITGIICAGYTTQSAALFARPTALSKALLGKGTSPSWTNDALTTSNLGAPYKAKSRAWRGAGKGTSAQAPLTYCPPPFWSATAPCLLQPAPPPSSAVASSNGGTAPGTPFSTMRNRHQYAAAIARLYREGDAYPTAFAPGGMWEPLVRKRDPDAQHAEVAAVFSAGLPQLVF